MPALRQVCSNAATTRPRRRRCSGPRHTHPIFGANHFVWPTGQVAHEITELFAPQCVSPGRPASRSRAAASPQSRQTQADFLFCRTSRMTISSRVSRNACLMFLAVLRGDHHRREAFLDFCGSRIAPTMKSMGCALRSAPGSGRCFRPARSRRDMQCSQARALKISAPRCASPFARTSPEDGNLLCRHLGILRPQSSGLREHARQ